MGERPPAVLDMQGVAAQENWVSRVLVVEDDPDLREVIASLIEESGSECLACSAFSEVEHEASGALTSHLAILDVNLGPDEPTGVEVSRWLRDRGYRGSIVFLTGHASTDPRVIEAARVPGTTVLTKPVGAVTLLELAEGT
jgi:DNA-binding response OmpR family regulator